MNNKLKLICVLPSLLCVLLSACAPLSSCSHESADQWVYRKFNKIKLPFEITPNKIVSEDREWFIAVQLTPKQAKEMLSDDFKRNGFLGWVENDRNISISGKNPYSIRKKDKLMVNYKSGSDQYNFIAMFLDTKKNIVVFCWCLTYGM